MRETEEIWQKTHLGSSLADIQMRVCLLFIAILTKAFTLESCFTQVGSTDRRDAIAVSLTTTQADCELACANKLECEAFTFNNSSSKCVLLGAKHVASPSGSCAKPYAVYEKCSSTSTSSPTLSTTTAPYDRCIAQSFPELTANKYDAWPCPLRNVNGSDGPLLVVRALTEAGEWITVENLPMSFKNGSIRMLQKSAVGGRSRYVNVTSFVCATVDGAKCPCGQPLPSVTHPDARCKSPPALNTSPPCANKFQYSDGFDLATVDGNQAFVTCDDGVYIRYELNRFIGNSLVQGCCI